MLALFPARVQERHRIAAVFSQTNREVHFDIKAERDLPQSESRRGSFFESGKADGLHSRSPEPVPQLPPITVSARTRSTGWPRLFEHEDLKEAVNG